MTFTQLATELCNLCGEGYQDYINRAKEHLYRAFDNLILTGQAREDEYYGLIDSATISFDVDIPVSSFPEVNSDNITKIITVKVDGVVVDRLTNEEFSRVSQMPDLVENICYYMIKDSFTFVNIPALFPNTVTISYVNKFKEGSPTYDINKLITNSFADKALLLAKPTLLEEINI